MFIVDSHLDLAYNFFEFDRDLRLPLADLRQREEGGTVPDRNGTATVTLPELRRGRIGLVFGTLFVGPYHKNRMTERVIYRNKRQAHNQAMRQLDYYHRLADEVPYVRLVTDSKSLDEVLTSQTRDNPLLGIVPLMEGADPIREPEEAEGWYEHGLRLVGLAWSNTRYAGGNWAGSGIGLSKEGQRLLDVMAGLGMILDHTHLSERSSLEALDRFEGMSVATHSNARKMVPDVQERHLGDIQIRRIAERGGVMGIVLANGFLKPGGRTLKKVDVTVADVAAHVDTICQLVGSAEHVGIGSDFDGGFGRESIPAEIDSAADLHLIGDALKARGYSDTDVAGVMGGNWVNLLRRVWK